MGLRSAPASRLAALIVCLPIQIAAALKTGRFRATVARGTARACSGYTAHEAMRPEVAASLFASVAHDWIEDASRLVAPIEGRAKVIASCAKVAGAIVNASAGDEMKVLSYMQTVCDRRTLQKQSAQLCNALGVGLVRAMKRDPECNRRIDVSEVCHSFYQGPLAEVVEQERHRRQQEEGSSGLATTSSAMRPPPVNRSAFSSGPVAGEKSATPATTTSAHGPPLLPAKGATAVHVSAVVAAKAATGAREAKQATTIAPAALRTAAVAEHESQHPVEELAQAHENEKQAKSDQLPGDSKGKTTKVLTSFVSIGHRMSSVAFATAEDVLPDGFMDDLVQTIQASVPTLTALWSRLRGSSA